MLSVKSTPVTVTLTPSTRVSNDRRSRSSTCRCRHPHLRARIGSRPTVAGWAERPRSQLQAARKEPDPPAATAPSVREQAPRSADLSTGHTPQRTEVRAPTATVTLLDRQARFPQALQGSHNNTDRQTCCARHPVRRDVVDPGRASGTFRQAGARHRDHLREHPQRILLGQSPKHRNTIAVDHPTTSTAGTGRYGNPGLLFRSSRPRRSVRRWALPPITCTVGT